MSSRILLSALALATISGLGCATPAPRDGMISCNPETFVLNDGQCPADWEECRLTGPDADDGLCFREGGGEDAGLDAGPPTDIGRNDAFALDTSSDVPLMDAPNDIGIATDTSGCALDPMRPIGTSCTPVNRCAGGSYECVGGTIRCVATDEILGAGTPCRPAVGLCDVVEECDGVSVACPFDRLAAETQSCRRAVAGGCDVEEFCSGDSAECPADEFENLGTLCPGGFCDTAHACNATCPAGQACTVAGVGHECERGTIQCPSGACGGTITIATGSVCRPAAGPCDAAESCAASNPACPPDGFVTGTQCRTASGDCDAPELCDGSGAGCPATNAVLGSAVECRPAVPLAMGGGCDIADFCDGTNPTCPMDSLAGLGTTCRPSMGACDTPESCTGSSTACPPATTLMCDAGMDALVNPDAPVPPDAGRDALVSSDSGIDAFDARDADAGDAGPPGVTVVPVFDGPALDLVSETGVVTIITKTSGIVADPIRCGGGIADCNATGSGPVTLDVQTPPWLDFVGWDAPATCGTSLSCSFVVSAPLVVRPRFRQRGNIGFVSSTGHDGNFGGLSGADAFCQGLADTARLPGTFVAFLGSSGAPPQTRLTGSGWVRVDGRPIVEVISDMVRPALAQSSLIHPINLNEAGMVVGDVTRAWTGAVSGVTGVVDVGNHCTNWTSSSNTVSGSTGATSSAGQLYTGNVTAVANGPCNALAPVYCMAAGPTFGPVTPPPPPANALRVFSINGRVDVGLATMDMRCQTAAMEIGYSNPSRFVAWVGRSTSTAMSLVPSGSDSWPVIRVDGWTVANNFTRLRTGDGHTVTSPGGRRWAGAASGWVTHHNNVITGIVRSTSPAPTGTVDRTLAPIGLSTCLDYTSTLLVNTFFRGQADGTYLDTWASVPRDIGNPLACDTTLPTSWVCIGGW